MARLGELLVAAGLLDADKLEQGLRAQIVWGGRLGTNLVELGFIDLDQLSTALGRLHGMPAALARHFDKADPLLQRRILPELADKHSFVPLVELMGGKIAIACMDCPDDDALAEIAGELGISSADLVVSIAAEQRMRYQLERVYNIARAARYLRSRGKSIPPFPEFGDFSDEPDSDVEIPIDWEVPAEPPAPPPPKKFVADRPPTQPDALAALIDRAISTVPAAAEPAGRERRTYVKTLADDPSPREPPPVPPANALGRIAIRKVAIGPRGELASSDADEPGLPDVAKAIRRSEHRDRVAELVLEAVEQFVPECEAAALLVVRGDTATTWLHFARSRAPLPNVAMPIDEPGLIPRALESTSSVRAPAGKLAALDRALLQALGADGELVVVPIAIAGKALCVIACAVEPGTPIADIETIATSAGTAFARLMRNTSR
jgi:Type II secretion system (T2SS), protein E, N-terminal domain